MVLPPCPDTMFDTLVFAAGRSAAKVPLSAPAAPTMSSAVPAANVGVEAQVTKPPLRASMQYVDAFIVQGPVPRATRAHVFACTVAPALATSVPFTPDTLEHDVATIPWGPLALMMLALNELQCSAKMACAWVLVASTVVA